MAAPYRACAGSARRPLHYLRLRAIALTLRDLRLRAIALTLRAKENFAIFSHERS
jgi:hypothetical protein